MSEHSRNATRQEAKLLSQLKHPCIIGFREVYTTASNKLCIVMDFAEGGDLQQRVKGACGGHFEEAMILDWFTQVCLGLKHVHDRKILHRDIKAQNVFLTRENRCLLGDFGIARVLSSTQGFAKTMVGTPYYLSPEIIENKHYGFKSDIWSLGVLLYELCALRPPFDAPSIRLLSARIIRGVYPALPSQYSHELRELASSMLSVDPERRPSVNQILDCGVINGRIKRFLSEPVYEAEFSHTILHDQNVLEKENKAANRVLELEIRAHERETRLRREKEQKKRRAVANNNNQPKSARRPPRPPLAWEDVAEPSHVKPMLPRMPILTPRVPHAPAMGKVQIGGRKKHRVGKRKLDPNGEKLREVEEARVRKKAREELRKQMQDYIKEQRKKAIQPQPEVQWLYCSQRGGGEPVAAPRNLPATPDGRKQIGFVTPNSEEHNRMLLRKGVEQILSADSDRERDDASGPDEDIKDSPELLPQVARDTDKAVARAYLEGRFGPRGVQRILSAMRSMLV